MRHRSIRLPAAVLVGLPVLLLPFISLSVAEIVHRASLASWFAWLFEQPGEWIAGYLLILGLFLVLNVLFKNIYWTFTALNLVTVASAAISRMKLKYRGEPILPWDLKLGGEALDVATFFSAQGFLNTFLPILAVVAIGGLLIWKMPVPSMGWKPRMVAAVAGFILLSSLFGGTMKAKQVMGLQTITWDQSMNYDQNGMLVGFLLNSQWMEVEKPERYTREAIEEIAVSGAPEEPAASTPIKPNIIMVMNEAFWDPTLMDQVSYSRDPIPFFRSLTQTHTSGKMLSPVYGGGTVNTEYEVLTGFSTQFLPAGSIAYSSYVRSPQESLATILKAQDYEATAIHTYHNWFYRRNEVYKLIGFDRFVSSEFFSQPEIRSGYISDRTLSERIIEEVKATEGPDFIFAVSMQNHGPYREGKNEENRIKVSGNLSEPSVSILETYVETLSDADESLRLLVEAFENSDEPTVILFFGDHLPMLGENYSVYREAGYFEDGILFDDYLRMYGVPFVIWDNFSEGTRPSYDDTYVSAFHLGHLTLQAAGQKGNPLTDYLQEMFRSGLTYLPRTDFRQELGLDEGMLEQYSLLHYDRLFGDGYSYDRDPPVSNEQYHLGSGLIQIHQAEPVASEEAGPAEGEGTTDGQTVLRLKGEHFVAGGSLLLNGKPVEWTFISGEELHVALPNELLETPLTLSFRVTDSLKRTIAESNAYEYVPRQAAGEPSG